MIKHILIKGVNLVYDEDGEGTPIILMHGWGCNHTTLNSISKNLIPNFKVYNIDFPGHGDTQAPDSVWGVDDYTQLIEEFVQKLDIKNPILLGHSFGGRVGILFSSRNSVRKLILTDAAGIKPHHSIKYYIKVYSFKLIKMILPFIIGRKNADIKINAYRNKVGSADYKNTSGVMRKVFVKVVNEDLCHVMPLIKCPTLLIWGSDDKATPIKDAKKMNKLIPDSGIVEFKGAGHYSFLDKPFEYNAVLQNFLKNDIKKS